MACETATQSSLYQSAKDQINVGVVNHIYPMGVSRIQSRRDIIGLIESGKYATLTFSDKYGRELYTWVAKLDDADRLAGWIKADGHGDRAVVRVDIIKKSADSISASSIVKREKTVTEWVQG